MKAVWQMKIIAKAIRLVDCLIDEKRVKARFLNIR